MSLTSNDRVRTPGGVSALNTGVTLTDGGVIPVKHIHTKAMTPIKHKVELPGNIFTFTASSGGGAADSLGQVIMTLPQGRFAVMGVKMELDAVIGTGYSSVDAVVGLGSAVATASDDTLTSTEADIMTAVELGDGDLAAGVSQATDKLVLGSATALTIIGSTSAESNVCLNIAGNWIHATLTAADVTVTGTVELMLLDLGDL